MCLCRLHAVGLGLSKAQGLRSELGLIDSGQMGRDHHHDTVRIHEELVLDVINTEIGNDIGNGIGNDIEEDNH